MNKILKKKLKGKNMGTTPHRQKPLNKDSITTEVKKHCPSKLDRREGISPNAFYYTSEQYLLYTYNTQWNLQENFRV